MKKDEKKRLFLKRSLHWSASEKAAVAMMLHFSSSQGVYMETGETKWPAMKRRLDCVCLLTCLLAFHCFKASRWKMSNAFDFSLFKLRMLRSQKTDSVITTGAVISVLICSETARHQHTWVFLLSSGWRLGEFIFLWDYLLYFFMQTVKNIDKLVTFFQKGIFCIGSKYLRDALIFIYPGKRVF